MKTKFHRLSRLSITKQDAGLNRNEFIKKLDEKELWDFIIIGGGASGLGIALDAASRGYSTLLLEQLDFAKATSSRSTKLIHGGVRYLAQGKIKLVYEALHEREILLKNAPHLVKRQLFVIPCYSRLQKLKYLIGLKLYDWLAGTQSQGRSLSLSRREAMERLPNIQTKGLVGAVQYYDAQFDDSRLAINLAQTTAENGGIVLNYFKVTSLLKKENKVQGVTALDVLTNKSYTLQARLVINATGVFVDNILKLDKAGQNPVVRPSMGVHLVVARSFLDSNDAILIPKTPDKRVLFLLPWRQHVLVGTTDTPVDKTLIDPIASEEDIDFILNTAKQYLVKSPQRRDVLSVFAGLRPLAALQNAKVSTKELSRDHKILISDSELLTVTGGKWTTYRKIAEEVVDKAVSIAGLQKVKPKTKEIRIHGYMVENGRSLYGSDEENINQLLKREPVLNENLSDQFPYKAAHVAWSVRKEMAVTVEDVLARRLRVLFSDARAAIAMAPKVAAIIANELGYDENWIQAEIKEFNQLAQQYLINTN